MSPCSWNRAKCPLLIFCADLQLFNYDMVPYGKHISIFSLHVDKCQKAFLVWLHKTETPPYEWPCCILCEWDWDSVVSSADLQITSYVTQEHGWRWSHSLTRGHLEHLYYHSMLPPPSMPMHEKVCGRLLWGMEWNWKALCCCTLATMMVFFSIRKSPKVQRGVKRNVLHINTWYYTCSDSSVKCWQLNSTSFARGKETRIH